MQLEKAASVEVVGLPAPPTLQTCHALVFSGIKQAAPQTPFQ